MNIVYLFLTYKNPELLLHTIQRLKAPHVEFYVHVDASSGEDFSCLQGIDGVYVLVNQHNTKWGTLSIYAIHLIISYLCHILIGKNRCLSLLLLGK